VERWEKKKWKNLEATRAKEVRPQNKRKTTLKRDWCSFKKKRNKFSDTKKGLTGHGTFFGAIKKTLYIKN